MPTPVVLSSGHTVSFKPDYTHRMETAFKDALMKGMNLRQQGEEVVVDQIRPDALDRAVEAVLDLLIDKVTKDGQDVAYNREWLLDLKEKDFLVLRDVVTTLRDENETQKETGKKIAETVGRTLRSKGKLYPREYALFRFCREFHCLPQDVFEMRDDLYDLFRAFLREEAEADSMEARRTRQRSPR